MKLDVITLDNGKAGSIDLKDEVFAAPVRKDVLARMVRWQLAKRRQGTHSTKGISEVQGTTKKPYKQKGTGSARQGSLRSPQFRGGGIIFGPLPRDHGYDLPKKVRKFAMRAALSSKNKDGKLVVIDAVTIGEPKTKALKTRLDKLGYGSVLFVGGPELDQNFVRAARNLHGVEVLPQQGANVYDILRQDTLVLSKDAVKYLEERLA
jgi:large subunit ribosomal protein L4